MTVIDRMDTGKAVEASLPQDALSSTPEVADRARSVVASLDGEIDGLRHGDHICSFHGGSDDQLDLAAAFVQEALRRGECCLYLTGDRSPEELGGRLAALGIDIDEMRRRQALLVVGKSDWRTRGEFDVEAMAAGVRESARRALAPGWPGIWIAVDMTWTLNPDIDPAQLAEWESYWNVLVHELPVVLLCQYNQQRLSAATLLWELRTHPYVVVEKSVVRNSYYEPPGVFSTGQDLPRLLEWRLDQLYRAERQRRESEQRYRSLVEFSPEAICVQSRDRVSYVNPAGVRLFGARGAEELVGTSLLDWIHPDERGGVQQWLENAQAGQSLDTVATRLLELSGREIDVEAIAMPIFYGGAPALQLVIRDVTERKRAEDLLREREKDLAVARERNRLAGEIHDTLAQIFVAIRFQIQAADPWVGASAELRQTTDRVITLADDGLRQAKGLVWRLVPIELDGRPIDSVLNAEMDRYGALGGWYGVFTVSGRRRDLSQRAQTALLRVCQEALSNINKHARAKIVSVRLSYRRDRVALDIHDDGTGVEPKLANGTRNGYGLASMKERCQEIGGDLTVVSRPGMGCLVRAVIPLDLTQEARRP